MKLVGLMIENKATEQRYKIIDVIEYRDERWMSACEEKETRPIVIGHPREERFYLIANSLIGEKYFFEGQYLKNEYDSKIPYLVQGPIYYQNKKKEYHIFSPQRTLFTVLY